MLLHEYETLRAEILARMRSRFDLLGIAVAALTSDVIFGVIAGAGFIAVAIQMVKLWTGHPGPPAVRH